MDLVQGLSSPARSFQCNGKTLLRNSFCPLEVRAMLGGPSQPLTFCMPFTEMFFPSTVPRGHLHLASCHYVLQDLLLHHTTSPTQLFSLICDSQKDCLARGVLEWEEGYSTVEYIPLISVLCGKKPAWKAEGCHILSSTT